VLKENSRNPESVKWALVTGATSGIGRAFVDLLANDGFNVVLLSRNVDLLRNTSKEVEGCYQVQTEIIPCDLGDECAPRAIIAELEKKKIVLDVLVNNAGFGDLQPFSQADWLLNKRQVNVMLSAVTELSYYAAQKMKENRQGWIINVASLAAFTPNMPGSMYNAIKSFVVNFSEALDLELKPHNVHCTALCPGMTKTNFPKAMGAEAFFAKIPEWRWMTSGQVAKEGIAAVLEGKSIHIPGKVNRLLAKMFQIMPNKLKYEMGKRGIVL
jgi:hypothetical protein